MLSETPIPILRVQELLVCMAPGCAAPALEMSACSCATSFAGGSFDLLHAQTHTVILQHALSYKAPEIPEVLDTLAKALPGNNGNAIRGLNFLLSELNVERSLKAFGRNEGDADKAADIAAPKPYYNPHKVERAAIQELIRRAWAWEDASTGL